MTHSQCMNHREHSLDKYSGVTAMLREHPTWSDIYNWLAPAFLSIMQNKWKKTLFISISTKIITTTTIHTHCLHIEIYTSFKLYNLPQFEQYLKVHTKTKRKGVGRANERSIAGLNE